MRHPRHCSPAPNQYRVAESWRPSRRPREQGSQSDQVVGNGGERHVPIDDVAAAVPQLPQAADRLHPPERLLDQLAPLLTDQVAVVTSRSLINDGIGEPAVQPLAECCAPLSTFGDLDGDGNADLIWRHTQTGDVSAWLMDGGLVRQAGVLWSGVPLTWQLAGMGDLDGSGHADLIWRHTETGDVSAWLMDGTIVRRGALLWAALWAAVR